MIPKVINNKEMHWYLALYRTCIGDMHVQLLMLNIRW